jgi:hypothetical protein
MRHADPGGCHCCSRARAGASTVFMIEAIAVDEIQASAGAQFVSASVPLLWMNRSGRVRPEFVVEQHCRPPLLQLVRSEHVVGREAGYRSRRRSGRRVLLSARSEAAAAAAGMLLLRWMQEPA